MLQPNLMAFKYEQIYRFYEASIYNFVRLQLAQEASPQTGRDTTFGFKYPQRKITLRSKRGPLSPEKYTHDIEIKYELDLFVSLHKLNKLLRSTD